MPKFKQSYFKPDFDYARDLFEGLVWKEPNSKGTDTYDVVCTEKGFTCDCLGFTFRGKCKHTVDVLTRVEQALDDRSPQYRWEYT